MTELLGKIIQQELENLAPELSLQFRLYGENGWSIWAEGISLPLILQEADRNMTLAAFSERRIKPWLIDIRRLTALQRDLHLLGVLS